MVRFARVDLCIHFRPLCACFVVDERSFQVLRALFQCVLFPVDAWNQQSGYIHAIGASLRGHFSAPITLAFQRRKMHKPTKFCQHREVVFRLVGVEGSCLFLRNKEGEGSARPPCSRAARPKTCFSTILWCFKISLDI